ncbi:MAG: MarR family winged helix-turn-helix transcriptional regulator [Solirubrobacterales bacterium]
MEAATKLASKGNPSAADRDLAVRFGSVMLHCLNTGGSGEFMRAIDESGLSFIQMKALLTVAGDDAEDASPVKLIAERLDVSLPSASRAVDALVKRKLATRVEDDADRRVRRVSLTAAGRELADRIMAARIAGLERFVGGLSAEERRKLDAAIAALLEREEIADVYTSYSRRLGK